MEVLLYCSLLLSLLFHRYPSVAVALVDSGMQVIQHDIEHVKVASNIGTLDNANELGGGDDHVIDENSGTIIQDSILLEHGDYGIYDLEAIQYHSNSPLVHQTSYSISDKGKQAITDIHNKYRSHEHGKFPELASQEYMEWDEMLELVAEHVADLCLTHEHDVLTDDKQYVQNDYHGPPLSVEDIIKLWFSEHRFFDFGSNSCEVTSPDSHTRTCYHFLTMMQHDSKQLGCAKSRCNPRSPDINFICYYSPRHFLGEPYFVLGPPCSRCSRTRTGLCYKNLCVDKKQCSKYNLECSCPLECQHCSKLNSVLCRCECQDGWDQLDCSEYCTDAIVRCPNGTKTEWACAFERYRNKDCRKSCSTCLVKDTKKSYPLCCKDILCPHGTTQANDEKCSCLEPGVRAIRHDDSRYKSDIIVRDNVTVNNNLSVHSISNNMPIFQSEWKIIILLFGMLMLKIFEPQ